MLYHTTGEFGHRIEYYLLIRQLQSFHGRYYIPYELLKPSTQAFKMAMDPPVDQLTC